MGEYDEEDRYYNSEQMYRRLHKRESDLSDKIYDKGDDNMELATRNNSRLGVAIILLVLIVYGLAQTTYLFSDSTEKKQCLEWGVIRRNNNTRGEDWAKINRIPMNEEEAEQIARELEAQELTGQYEYEARCKRYKQ